MEGIVVFIGIGAAALLLYYVFLLMKGDDRG